MLKIILLICCFFASLYCVAATLKTTDGVEYKNYEIVEPRHNGLAVMHDNGVDVIPYDKLPPDLQKKYAPGASDLKKKEIERRRKFNLYQKKQQEQKKLLKRLPEITFHFFRIKIIRVLDKNRVLATFEPVVEIGYYNSVNIIITDVDTTNLSNDTYMKKNCELRVQWDYAKKTEREGFVGEFVNATKLFFIGTSKMIVKNKQVGQVWKFTTSQRVAMDVLKKNLNIRPPEIYWWACAKKGLYK